MLSGLAYVNLTAGCNLCASAISGSGSLVPFSLMNSTEFEAYGMQRRAESYSPVLYMLFLYINGQRRAESGWRVETYLYYTIPKLSLPVTTGMAPC